MKQLIAAVLFGLIFSIPAVTAQTSGFSQRGRVSNGLRADGFLIAHSSLPLNSKAKIVNTLTGKELEVTVARHIQATEDVIADVSPSVWQELKLTPDTDVRIYTSASARPQTAAASPAADRPQAAAASPAASTAQGGGDTFPSGGYGNVQGGVKFENNFIINGLPVALADSAAEVSKQTARPAAVGTQAQAAQPAYTAQPTAYETRTQTVRLITPPPRPTVPPDMVSETWARIARSAMAGLAKAQAARSGVAAAQPVSIVEARPQAVAPTAASETRAAQSGASYEAWIQTAQPPAETSPQAIPTAASETRARPAESWAQPTAARLSPVIIETTPMADRSAVIIETPQTSRPALIIETPPQAFPAMPAMPAMPAIGTSPQAYQPAQVIIRN